MSEPADDTNVSGKETNPKRRRKWPHGRRRSNKRKSAKEGVAHENVPTSNDATVLKKAENTGEGDGFKKSKGRGNTPSRRKSQTGERPLYAALDLGTNNCRLLIATPQRAGRFRVVDGYSKIVRLGEGLSQSGKLSEAAMERAIEALKACAVKLANRPLKNQRLIATEACRQAENGEYFLARVREEAGLELEVVSREMEAHLAAEGCGALVDRESDGAVLFDIGGGSSELVLIKRENKKRRRISDHIAGWTSLPMGVVTLAEEFGGRDVSHSLFAEMVECVTREIEKFEGRGLVDDVFSGGNVHLLGTSGTVTTLAGIHLKLPKYDRRRVDGLWMRDDDIDDIVNALIDMPFEDRAANPCIGEERADLVLAGCAILNAIRKAWPADRLRVADRGLREGLLSDMMNRDRSWLGSSKPRWSRKRRKKQRDIGKNGGNS